MTTGERILDELRYRGPMKDSELAKVLQVAHQQVNQAARALESRGLISRDRASDGLIRNEIVDPEGIDVPQPPQHKGLTLSDSATARRPLRQLGVRASGAPVIRGELLASGFREHRLRLLEPADALGELDGLNWDTLGDVPNAPGLYCFVAEDAHSNELRIMYVGMTTHLYMVAKGTHPVYGARGGQRYGRPKHAGTTRKRINAEVARLVADGMCVAHWLRPIDIPAQLDPALHPRAEEERLIKEWNLRIVGWNRG